MAVRNWGNPQEAPEGEAFCSPTVKIPKPKKGYCRNGHECLPNAKTVYIITKCEPKSKRIILILFQLNNMSPTKWGLLRSLFCMTKKNMFPTKVLLVFIRFKSSTKTQPTYKSMCSSSVWESIFLVEIELAGALKHSLLVVEILTPIK
jgi:hypothetical protein